MWSFLTSRLIISSLNCQHSWTSAPWPMTFSVWFNVLSVGQASLTRKQSYWFLVSSLCVAALPPGPGSQFSLLQHSAPGSQPPSQVPAHLGFGKLLKGLLSQNRPSIEKTPLRTSPVENTQPQGKNAKQPFCRMFCCVGLFYCFLLVTFNFCLHKLDKGGLKS